MLIVFSWAIRNCGLLLLRSLIDCLYNITTILDNPAENAPRFRRSGLKNAFEALKQDEEKYGGKKEWDEWIQKRRDQLLSEMKRTKIEMKSVLLCFEQVLLM